MVGIEIVGVKYMLMGKRDRMLKAQYNYINMPYSKLYTQIKNRCGYIKRMVGVRITLLT